MRALAVVLVAVLALTLRSSDSTFAETATPINHVIVIVQENHSFDNYFGTYPTANGTLINDVTSQLQPVDGIPNGICVLYAAGCLSPYRAKVGNTESPIEGQVTYENDYDNGKMAGSRLIPAPSPWPTSTTIRSQRTGSTPRNTAYPTTTSQPHFLRPIPIG